MYVQTIHQLIGQTPLLEITGFGMPENSKIFAKLEMFNPGGSIKDRLGKNFIETALKRGIIDKNTNIIEPTAGNTGIGLALAALPYQLKVTVVVPKKFSVEKQMLMKALGAEIIHTPTEKGMKGAIDQTEELLQKRPNSYSPRQFENMDNPMTYYETVGPEIVQDHPEPFSSFVAGAGSGGTFTGVASYLKEQQPSIRTTIVEPSGSILNGGPSHSHRTEGIGMEFVPKFVNQNLFDHIYTISDDEAFYYVKELAKTQGIFVGSSSGAAFAAALKEAKSLPNGSHIVTIFPDSSERYLSNHIYD